MVLVLDGKTTYIEIPSTRTLQSVPQDSFEIEIICKGEIPEHEEEYLIGDEDIQYVKYPIISKRGYDFEIDFNNSNAYASSMWDFKNKHYSMATYPTTLNHNESTAYSDIYNIRCARIIHASHVTK